MQRFGEHLGEPALRYLGGISYAEWKQRVMQYSSYSLLEGPSAVLDGCQALLDEQQAEYRIVYRPERSVAELMLVLIGESTFICGDAEVSVAPDLRAKQTDPRRHRPP